jgi:hypothetical protein
MMQIVFTGKKYIRAKALLLRYMTYPGLKSGVSENGLLSLAFSQG